MYKKKIYYFLFTLLGLIISSTVWADEIPQNVTPKLTSKDEVCIFLQSPTQATFNFWAWGGSYVQQKKADGTAIDYPGDQFTLVGQQSDGLYLYKWTLPEGASGIPGTFIICKNWSETNNNKIYNNKPFSNHAIYMDELVTKENDYATATDITGDTDPLIKQDPYTMYLLSPVQRDYYFWAWGSLGGGGWYTVKPDVNGNPTKDDNGNYIANVDANNGNAALGWPGDKMTYEGKVGNKYLYKWVQLINKTTTTTDADGNQTTTQTTPSQFIITYNEGNSRILDGVAFNPSKYYDETIEDVPQGGDDVYMSGTAQVIDETPQEESKLPKIAQLNTPEEISAFLESSVAPNDANYHIWPYISEEIGGENFTADSLAYPGPKFEYVGNFTNSAGQVRYLYKWTEDSHIHLMPIKFTINTGADVNLDDHKIYKDQNFTNHGYYIVNADNTVSYSDVVNRQADGSYATSRTTYGKRVVYELNFGEFSSAADGQKIKDATKRLSYLKDLGVDVIYVMPIYQRIKGSSPYAATNLKEVNSVYGTLEDMQNFVTQAHLMGMDVWLDFAPNHVGVNNIWAVKDVDDKGNPQNNYHPEYFTQDKSANNKAYDADKNPEGFVHPNGYNDVWQLDYQTLTTVDGIEGVNPAGEAIKDILLYWVEQLNIDGYRFDYVSSPTVPDAFWNGITTALKAEKPSLQFLAERDFSQGNTPDPSYFTYDYAWDFNDDLRQFGMNLSSYTATPNEEQKGKTASASDHLTDITKLRVDNFDNSNIDPMVYLTNHDMNWNTDSRWGAKTPKSMNDAWGLNRFPMTVYEFTMPGMPLIYNGQEQNGTLSLDYFNEPSIDWNNTRDPRMRYLIQTLASLKHSNNALNDGYTKDQRGDIVYLNTYNHNVFAYERIKGDNHLLVVLNFSNVTRECNIAGTTPGTWTKILEGNNQDMSTPNTTAQITDTWDCTNIPANGYQIWSYTGPRKKHVNAGLYFVTDDSWLNPTKHVMAKQRDGSYQFMFEASEFDALNTEAGDVKPKDKDNTIFFKLQEYYDWKGTTCKTDQMLGAYDNANAKFSASNLSYAAKKDGGVNKDDPDNENESLRKKNDYSFSLDKSNDNDILRYIFTFTPDAGGMESGTLTLKIVRKGEITDGWYLETPVNITSEDINERLKWRFKTESEDPDAVSDNYLRYKIKDEKPILASYTIDADLFDRYMPKDGRQNLDVIQFRIQRVDNGLENKNDDGDVTQVQPSNNETDPTLSTFDESVNPNKWYKDSWWQPYDESNQKWFTLKWNNAVDKYIIQIWRNNSYTSVKVYYVMKYDYTGSDIHDITASGEDVYLYNVDAHKFLYTGNTWGTMASLLYKDLGTRMNISKGLTGENPDYKMIRTKFENNTTVTNGHMMGIDDFSYKAIANPQNDYDKFINLDSANIFLDRDNGNRWIMERVDTNDVTNTYILRLYDKKDGRFHMMLAAHDPDPESNINTHVIYIAQNVTTVDASDMPQSAADSPKNGVTFKGDRIHKDGTKTNTRNSTFIGWINNDNYITYKYNAVKNGTYDITVKYLNAPADGKNRNLKISVAGVDSIQQCPKNTTSWRDRSVSSEMSYSFHMNKGENTITFGSKDEPSPNIVSFSIRMTRPDDLTYARWQFVTYNDLMEKLRSDNAEVYGSTNADATFLMKDQGFTRYIQNTWDTDNSKTDSYAITYTTEADRKDTSLPTSYNPAKDEAKKSTVTCTKNKIGDNRVTGMYWNGHINGKGLVYQDIDVPVYGIYQFDAYGFWHGSTTRMFYQYATGFDANGNATGWSNMYVGHALKHSDKGYNATLKNKDGKDNSKQNDVETGEEIYKESVLGSSDPVLLNTQYTYIPEDAAHDANNKGNYRLRIGFFKTAEDVDNGNADKDYTAVDDVHLHYKGKAPFTLDDSWGEGDFSTKISNEKRQSVPVWLKRKFVAGQWNTVVLPLDVSVSTLQDLFGPSVEVERPYGLDPKNPNRIMFTNVDLTNANGVALRAGNYYIVKPQTGKVTGNLSVPVFNSATNSVDEDEITSNDGTQFLYLGTYDLREGTTNKANLEAGAQPGEINDFHPTSAADTKSEHNAISVIGSYVQTYVSATSKAEQKEGLYNYVFNTSKGNVTRLTDPTKSYVMNGYRFYFHDISNPNKKADSKENAFSSSSLDDNLYAILALYNKKGEATGIENVNAETDDNSKFNDGYVYDLSGRRVGEGGKIDALPRGVYILNGKKFIKK